MKKNMYLPGFALVFIIVFYVLFFQSSGNLYGNTCEYTSEIQACKDENAKGGDPRKFDFLCPAAANNESFQAYQVVLDREFNKIDLEAEAYLNSLEKNKSQFYSGGKTYLDGYDEISSKFGMYGEYWFKYYNLCKIGNPSGVVQKTLACLPEGSPASTLGSFAQETECQRLIETKLEVYRDVADNILYLNKAYNIANRQISYLGQQTDTYSSLVEKFVYNIGMIYRVNKKYQNRNPDGYK